METCFNYTDEKAYFSSDERKWVNRIKKFASEHPDEVRILKAPEFNDGCIYVELPSNWLKIQPKRKVELSEEEKNILRNRLAHMRASSELQNNPEEN